MMTKRKKEQIFVFKKFLVNNHVYNNFINCLETSGNDFKEIYSFNSSKDFLENFPAEQFIGYAFNWSRTKNGHCFWEKLDDMWKHHLREYNYVIS